MNNVIVAALNLGIEMSVENSTTVVMVNGNCVIPVRMDGVYFSYHTDDSNLRVMDVRSIKQVTLDGVTHGDAVHFSPAPEPQTYPVINESMMRNLLEVQLSKVDVLMKFQEETHWCFERASLFLVIGDELYEYEVGSRMIHQINTMVFADVCQEGCRDSNETLILKGCNRLEVGEFHDKYGC